MKKIKVKDLGQVVTGHTPPTAQREYYGDLYPFLKPTDMTIGQRFTHITEEGYSDLAAKKYQKSLIPKGSTCVVCIGTIGEKMSMAPCDLFTNQSINSIIPDEQNFDPYYVFYLLKHNLHRVKLLNKGTASGREFVSKTTFLDLEIDVFEDMDIQKRIAAILSTYDDLIENNQKQIKLLEEAAQRLYKEWFVDLRFPGWETAKIVDGVPEGWELSVLDNICSLSKPVITPQKMPRDSAYIGLEHMPRKSICLSEWGNSNDVNSNKFRYVEDDILFGKIRPYFHKVGFALNSGVASTDSIIMKAKDKMWCLLLMTVSSAAFVDYSSTTCKEGSKMPRADWEHMKVYPVLLPDDDILNQFNDFIWRVTRQIKTLALQNRAIAEARDRLLPKLMSGELEV